MKYFKELFCFCLFPNMFMNDHYYYPLTVVAFRNFPEYLHLHFILHEKAN